MENNKNKWWAIAAFMLFVLLPLQEHLKLFQLEPLKGAFVKKEKPNWSVSSWLSSDFQNDLEVYLKENFGFRSTCVRIHNELQFRLFGESSSKGTVIGKQGMLFQESHIETLFGEDFIGDSLIYQKVLKVKAIQDTLSKLGVAFVPIIAPNKARYFEEYLPEEWQTQTKKKTNAEAYSFYFDSLQVSNINFSKLFMSLKDTVSNPLFPYYGIHWSEYAEILVTDSLLKYVSEAASVVPPVMVVDSIQSGFNISSSEYDIYEPMNLLFQPAEKFPTINTYYHSSFPKGSRKLKSLIIADSFYNQLYDSFQPQFLENSAYWYYNRTIKTFQEEYPSKPSKVHLQNEVELMDAVIVLFTEQNMKDFAYRFIDRLYGVYFEGTPPVLTQEAINRFAKELSSNPDQLKYIKEKAKERGYTWEEMLMLDAEWLAEREMKMN